MTNAVEAKPALRNELDISEISTCREIAPSLTKAGKQVRQAYAVIHSTLCLALIKKSGSRDAFLQQLKSQGASAEVIDFAKRQLTQCAVINDVLKPDLRLVAKNYNLTNYHSYAAAVFLDWAASNNRALAAERLLHFLITALSAACGQPENLAKAIQGDATFDKGEKKAIKAVLRAIEEETASGNDTENDGNGDDDDDDDEDWDLPAMSDSVMPILSAALTPSDLAIFRILTSSLFMCTFSWAVQRVATERGSFTMALQRHIEDVHAFSLLQKQETAEERAVLEQAAEDEFKRFADRAPEDIIQTLGEKAECIAKAINQLSDDDYDIMNVLFGNGVQFIQLMRMDLTKKELDKLAASVKVDAGILPMATIFCNQIEQAMQKFPRRSFVGTKSDD